MAFQSFVSGGIEYDDIRRSPDQNKLTNALGPALGEINISDIDALSYFFVYGQLGMLLEHGSEKDCSKRIQDTLIEILNL